MEKNFQDLEHQTKNDHKDQFIYLIREREFIRLNEQTYKLGKTKQKPNTRLGGYPKDSEILLFRKVDNCDLLENELIKSFKQKFKHQKQYGREYFEGDKDEMMNEISVKCQQEVSDIHNQNEVKSVLLNNSMENDQIAKQTDSNTNIIGYICSYCKCSHSVETPISTKKQYKCSYCQRVFSRSEIQQLKAQMEAMQKQIINQNREFTERISNIEKDPKLVNNFLQVI
jgi:transposase-like protein